MSTKNLYVCGGGYSTKEDEKHKMIQEFQRDTQKTMSTKMGEIHRFKL